MSDSDPKLLKPLVGEDHLPTEEEDEEEEGILEEKEEMMDEEKPKPSKPSKKHRHPLGELHLRIFSWSFLILSQIGMIMLFFDEFRAALVKHDSSDSSSSSHHGNPVKFFGLLFSVLQYCSMPLTLIANISIILREREQYWVCVVRYGGFTIGIFLFYLFIYFRYIVSLIVDVTGCSYSTACAVVDAFLSKIFGFLRLINMFVDLFVCSLIAFFVFYYPKRFFKGRLLYVFRGLAIIPLTWNILAYIFLGLNNEGSLIPGYLFPLIPLKPPLFLVVFLTIVLYLKVKEKRFMKNGGTLDEYNKSFFSQQSVHSFSRFSSIALGIGSAIDLVFLILYLIVYDDALLRVGFGQSCLMFFVIPIVWYYDFTKANNDLLLIFLVPIVSIVLIGMMWVEAGYWMIDLVVQVAKAAWKWGS